MSKEEIISGSKLIAKYLGFVYIPFSADLKNLKPGWYKVVDATPKMEEVTQTSFTSGKEEETEIKRITIDVNKLRYNTKSGYKLVEGNYYKFICRNHGDLRFWNSLDALIPIIQKIEKEDGAVFELRSNGCIILKWGLKLKTLDNGRSYDLPTWSNNVFKVIVEYLKTKK
jgi:hypothetical protein